MSSGFLPVLGVSCTFRAKPPWGSCRAPCSAPGLGSIIRILGTAGCQHLDGNTLQHPREHRAEELGEKGHVIRQHCLDFAPKFVPRSASITRKTGSRRISPCLLVLGARAAPGPASSCCLCFEAGADVTAPSMSIQWLVLVPGC